MSRRKENVRKACERINYLADKLFYCVELGKIKLAEYYWKEIKVETHRIKRTTWRGSEPQDKKNTAIKPNVSY